MPLAIVGFALIAILMYVLITEKMTPPVAFIILPLIAALLTGAGIAELSEYISAGVSSIANTAVLFLFSISYFTLMSELGLFDPIVDFIVSKVGNRLTAIFIAVILVTIVGHLDGSGASTYLITVPAFMPIMKRMNVRSTALLGVMAPTMSMMNLLPWAGPTIRAASVAEVEVFDLYRFLFPSVVIMFIVAVVIAIFNSRRETARGAGLDQGEAIIEANTGEEQLKMTKGQYTFNLILTIILLVVLFADIGLPTYFPFMLAFAIAIIFNFNTVKEQSKKIEEYGNNAIVMVMTLFAVGIFIGIIQNGGMVEAMAEAIINVLPDSFAPHLHWYMALFSVPLMMALGTDAFYFALLPIVMGVVTNYGISEEVVAATFLLTGTYGTFISPTVAANYVGVGLAETSIGEHIKQNFFIQWIASIVVLILSTLVGVIQY